MSDKEHPAYKIWKAEGETPKEAQVIQDARLELASIREQLDRLTISINNMRVAHEKETDENEKSALGIAIIAWDKQRAELERIIADSEQEFKDQGNISSKPPTLH